MNQITPDPSDNAQFSKSDRRAWNIWIVIGLIVGIIPGLVLIALRPPRSRNKTLFCLIGVIAVVALGIVNNEPSDETNKSTKNTNDSQSVNSSNSYPYGVEINDTDAVEQMIAGKCEDFKLQLFLSTAAAGKQMIEVAQAVSDAYSASRYVSATDVVLDWSRRLNMQLDTLFLADLNKFSLNAVSSVPNQFLVRAAELCDLTSEFDKAVDSAREADTDASRVMTLSNNVPWYPEGYKLLADGVAGRWAENIRCSGFVERCWELEITTEFGCPNDLYVELTLLDANEFNIGFTNDTTGPVRIGDFAKMRFDSYDRSAQKARVADVSCY